jgi:hypothetical protein
MKKKAQLLEGFGEKHIFLTQQEGYLIDFSNNGSNSGKYKAFYSLLWVVLAGTLLASCVAVADNGRF